MAGKILDNEQVAALTGLWQMAVGGNKMEPGQWDAQLKQVYKLGLGMQEILQVLYGEKPGLTAFLEWSASRSRKEATVETAEDNVLGEADLAHWRMNGYVVIKQAIRPAECLAAANAIWEFLGAHPLQPESWYRPHPAKNGLMVVFTQHPALEAIRHSARIRKAFEQLYGTRAIYGIIDKVSFNPPENDQYRFAGSPLHWDTSLQLPIPERFQGLLYLSDVAANGGAFQCVPGFHLQLAGWLKNLPAGKNPREHAAETLQPVSISGNAGDFIIWHQALPHCASPNQGNLPRLVQYHTYIPENYTDRREWI